MDQKLFNQQVQKLTPSLYRFAYWKLGNKVFAEDAVQDTFMKMWLMKNKLENYKRVDSLAYKILRNICIDIFRKQKKEKVNLDLVQHTLTNNEPTSQQRLELKEKIQRIEELVSKLPEQQQLIFHLRNLEGKEIIEISEALNIKPNTVEVNLSRARKKINELLNNE